MTPVLGLDPRRAAVAVGVIGAYVALGFAFRLSADAYLLVGIPITVGFQALVARRPLRSMWLRTAPSFDFTWRDLSAIAVLAIAPVALAIGGLRSGDPVRVGYGVAGIVGAVAAVYAIRAMDRDAVRATLRGAAIGSGAIVGVMVAFRLATGGFAGDVGVAGVAVLVALATYLPVVFVIEEVLFRGVLDPYLLGADAGRGRASAVFGSALWGLWHLPVLTVALGAITIPYLIGIHVVLGCTLVAAWRRTGNLGAPGIAHAVIDALRNGVAVL